MATDVVLMHGLWMTPLSWQGWAERLGARGYTVHTPAWPRMDRSIEELRANPGLVGGLGIAEIVTHHAEFIDSLDSKPVIIGHSMGGLLVQLLLDRGYAAAGVAVHPAQTKGVYRLPPAQLRAALPVVANPLNLRRGVPLTAEQFHWGFANALSEADSLAAYERLHVPAPARPLFQVAFANFTAGAVTAVNYAKPDRAPLLLLSGSLDRILPSSVVAENHRRYRRGTVEYRDYPGRSHATVGEPGWETVLDESMEWVEAHTKD